VEHAFFLQEDIVKVAEQLLGKYLFTCIDGQLAGGIITETEAYQGVTDRACHAFGGRRTARNEAMYAQGGVAYIYLCYGVHYLFNIVTNTANNPDAVLIRSIMPTHGEELILKRTKKRQISYAVTNGPGKVTKALGINITHNKTTLYNSETIWLEDRQLFIPSNKINKGTRIGVDYAGEDALLPYRFWIEKETVEFLRRDN